MNDQSQLMNKHQVMSHSHVINQSQLVNQSQIMNQSQILNQMGQSQMMNPPLPAMSSQAQMVNQMNQPPQMINPMVSQPQMVSQPPQLMNQSKMMRQGYGNWTQVPSTMPPMNNLKFPNPMNPFYGVAKPVGRSNWKGKKVIMDKRKDGRRKDKLMAAGAASGVTLSGSNLGPVGGGGGGYKPPSLNELEQQNRLKARRFYPRKKFNRMGPYAHAPRNTTSYIIRSKKSGGIASLVSPCPVTPAVLPTPVFSPSREALVDMAKEEWGVDGYGSMKGLIRLRSSPGHEGEIDDYEDEDDGSSESDVEEHVEVERRLNHDLSRFEMIYPNHGVDHHNVLENRVDDQDTHIAQLEEENLILKERLYLMERELGDLRRRLQCLERQNQVVEDINEEVVENISENDSEGTEDVNLMDDKHNEEVDYAPEFEQTRSEQADVVKAEPFELMESEASKKQVVCIDSKDEGKDLILEKTEPYELMEGEASQKQVVCVDSKEEGKDSTLKLNNESASLDVKQGSDQETNCIKEEEEHAQIAAVADKVTMIELEFNEDLNCDKEARVGVKVHDVEEIVKNEGTGDVAMEESLVEEAKVDDDDTSNKLQ